MNSELKGLILWVAYAAALVVAFFGIRQYRDDKPSPPRPILSVKSNLADLERDGEMRLRFLLESPATSRIEVGYQVVSATARIGRDFRVSSPSPLVIEPGATEATLVLSEVRPHPRVPAASKAAVVKVSLKGGSGFEVADGTRSSWEFPLTVRENPPLYTVTMIPPGDFHQKDARMREMLPVVFRLDRAPSESSISVRYRIGGNAGAADFEVVDAPSDGRIRFTPEQGRAARLLLRRLPGPRGRGNRKILVECSPDTDGRVFLAPGGLGVVEIGISDPESRLAWSVDPPIAGSIPDKPAIARLTISLTPPSSETVNFSYSMMIDPEPGAKRYSLTMEPPPDPWALDARIAVVTHEIPPAKPIFRNKAPVAQGRKVRLEPDPRFASPPKPLEIAVPDANSRALSGSILVVLLLTDKLTDAELRGIESILETPDLKPLRDRLVNGTVFVLDADRELAPLDMTTIKTRKRFPAGARIDEMLGNWSKDLFREVHDRLSEKNKGKEKRALMVHDIVIQNPTAIAAGLSGGLLGNPWTIFWIVPFPDPPREAKLTEAIRQNRSRLEIVRSDLSKRLLDFLKDQPGR